MIAYICKNITCPIFHSIQASIISFDLKSNCLSKLHTKTHSIDIAKQAFSEKGAFLNNGSAVRHTT